MNDDTIADLKQFIAATVRQETTELRQEFSGLSAKIDDLQTSVSQALDTSNDAIDDQIEDHEVRMHGRLKHKAA